MIHQIKTFLSKVNHVQWLLFCTFVLILFLKSLLFHWDAFHVILISSLWSDPLSFYKFYMAKLLMPLFISSFLFISHKRWWTIIVAVIVDIWCISNLIYYKTYNAFLTVNDILLANNMDGAWSSITAYFDGSMILLVILTIIWGLFVFLLRKRIESRRWIIFVSSLLILFVLAYMNNYLIYSLKFGSSASKEEASQVEAEQKEWITFADTNGRIKTYMNYIPFYEIYNQATDCGSLPQPNFMDYYIKSQSIISDLIAISLYYLCNNNSPGDIMPLSDSEKELILPYIHFITKETFPKKNLIVILVESLEDWPLHHKIENQEIAPYLNRLKQQQNVLYCDKIKCQTLGGNSGDGQMIVNTGILPIQGGVACMLYGNNIYPNFAHFYSNSIMVNPWPGIWNQDTMSIRYSYTQKIEPESGGWEDAQVLKTSIEHLKNLKTPTCLMAITVSTHAPFNRIRNKTLQTNAPSILNRYMQCLNYTDSCIACFMNYVLGDSLLSQSTIVITGDHTIFKPAMLRDFTSYAQEQNLSIASGDNYCPLIIYSPQIKENIHITDTCYQMDIFPTILHLIGCEDYYWRGLGVNLLDEEARHNRPISEQEAYRISDLIIRSDYFSTLTE